MIPNELHKLADNYFADRGDEFDLTTNKGCGQYIEHFVNFARASGFDKVGHLKKYGGTMWNGHANDSFLYNEKVDGKLQSVDIIVNAEAKPPYSNRNDMPRAGFIIDEPRYESKDWMAEPADSSNDSNSDENSGISFPGYESLGGDSLARRELGRAYAYDSLRAGQTKINSGTVIWPFRVLYDTFFDIIVHKKDGPSAMKTMVEKQRKEWCKIMGINVVPVPVDFEP